MTPNTTQTIQIFGAVTEAAEQSLRAQLATLDPAQRVTVEINSEGGSVQAGVAIYQMLSAWPAGVTTRVTGWALSVASAIFLAGDRREVTDTSLMMIHAPWLSTSGNSDQLREAAAVLDQVKKSLATVYAKTGQPAAVVAGWLDGKDHWFTADEIQRLRLSTHLVETPAIRAIPANAMAAIKTMNPPIRILQKLNAMTTPVITTQPNTTQATQATQAAFADAQRRAEIRAGFQPFAGREGMAELCTKLENDPKVTVVAAHQAILAKLGENTTPIAGGRVISYGDDRLTEFKAAAQDVLLQRAGVKVPTPHPAVADLRRHRLADMAYDLLSMSGRLPADKSPASLISAAMGTSDFAELLANTAARSLRTGYLEQQGSHLSITSEREVPDFREQSLINLSAAPDLLEVPEFAEYKSGNVVDSASKFKVVTHGRLLQISRQALINDDLSAFTQLPAAFGAAARRKEADEVFKQITGNVTMGDGQALFSSQHGNLAASGAVLSVDSLGAARAAMRRQKSPGGLSYLDIQPAVLLVPTELQTIAEAIVASFVDPAKQNDAANPAWVRGLTVVADPRLDEHSNVCWYMFAAPTSVDGLTRAYLAGQERPYIEENDEFIRDVMSLKCRLDFGVGVIDYRAAYKNPGQ